MGKHHESKRDHPEAQNREKAEHAAYDQRKPNEGPCQARVRQRNALPSDFETLPGRGRWRFIHSLVLESVIVAEIRFDHANLT